MHFFILSLRYISNICLASVPFIMLQIRMVRGGARYIKVLLAMVTIEGNCWGVIALDIIISVALYIVKLMFLSFLRQCNCTDFCEVWVSL
jgi:hypothetical protein